MVDLTQIVHGAGNAFWGLPVSGEACLLAGSQYSSGQLDLGGGTSTTIFPFLQGYPATTEVGYLSPAEVPGSGVMFGAHVRITGAFDNVSAVQVYVCSSAISNPVFNLNSIGARTFTLGQWQIVGAHYFIPVPVAAVQRYNRLYFEVTGSWPDTGSLVAWFGEAAGNEL